MADYSAGTAYLEILPSFDGVQDAIGREVRRMESSLGKKAGEEWGKNFEEQAVKAVDKALGTTTAEKAAEKAGKDAGAKYAGAFAEQMKSALRIAQREVTASIKLTGDDKEVKAQLKALQADIRSMSKTKIGIDMDASSARVFFEDLRKRLEAVKEAAAGVDLEFNFAQAATALEAFEKRLDKLNAVIEIEVDDQKLGQFARTVKSRLASALKDIPPVAFDADVTPAQQKLLELRQRMSELSDKTIGIDITGEEVLGEIADIHAALATLATDTDVDVQVRSDAAAAAKDLLAVQSLAQAVNGTKVEIDVEVDRDGTFASRMHRLRDSLVGGGKDGQDAANSFRAFNAVLLTGAAILPAAVPAVAALGGALALLGPLALGAAGGLAVLGIGFSGIGDAVSALGKVQETAGRDAVAAARTMAAAGQAVEDAERSLVRARESAAQAADAASRQVSRAIENQREAEQDLVRAQQEVLRAQEDVNRAREDAKDRIEDLRLSIVGGALAEREAVLDLKDAQEEYNDSLGDPDASADDRERLLIDLEQAKLRVEQLGVSNGRLAEEQAEVARTGVEGSREVVGAQGRVAAAQEGVSAAMAAVADASRGVEDALRAQQQTNADSTQAIGDAQRNLTRAQQAYGDALYDTSVVGSASMQALETSMGKLGPAGQEFAFFWAALLPQFRDLRNLVQEGMFPGLQEAISDILTVNGPLLATFMTNMGETLGGLFKQFGDMMTSPQWMAIWATFNEYAPLFMQQFGEVAMAMLTFFGELFRGLAPYAAQFGDALVRLAVSSAEWMSTFVDSPQFREIMEWLFTNGPAIFDDLWSIAKALGAIFIALLPLGLVVLDIIAGIADWISGLDPQVIGAIAMAVLGLFVSFQLASGAVALLMGFFAILTGGLSLWVFAIGAVITALVALYMNSETARDIMDAAFRMIGDVISWVWESVIKPVFGWLQDGWNYLVESFSGGGNTLGQILEAIGAYYTWLWNDIINPIFEVWQIIWGVLWGVISDVWEGIGKPLFNALWQVLQDAWDIIKPILELLGMLFMYVMDWMVGAWENVGKPVFDALIAITKFLWENVFSPLFGFIADRFGMTMEFFLLAWHSIGKPVFDLVQAVVESLVAIFSGNFDQLDDIWNNFWDSLKNAASKPINFVIHFVLNEGLFKAFNTIIDTLGLDKSWKLGPIGQVGDRSTHYAAGGRVRGWSPHDKADNIPAMLTANEFVQPVNTVDYYGLDIMERIRRKQIPREALEYFANGGLVQYRATGGQIADLTRTVFPRAKLNSSYRPGDPGYHGRNQAADLGEAGFPGGAGRPYIAAMKRWWVDNYGARAAEIIYNGIGNDRTNINNGRPFAYSAATQRAHFNHLHVAYPGALGGAVGGADFAGLSTSAGGGVDLPWWMDIWNDVTAVFGSIKDAITAPIENFKAAFSDSTLAKTVTAMPGKAVDWVWGKIKDVVGGLFAGADDAVTVAKGTGNVQEIVKAVAAAYGWNNGVEWSSLQTLVQKESSWNPNAQNPTSTAYGLFQFLNSTWAGTRIAKTSDPARQAEAGLRYISDRYGSPSKALAFHRANNWYSEGGPVTAEGAEAPAGAPTLYDTGGWIPPGITTVLNATNKPEPVLTNDAWQELISARSGGGDTGSAPVIGSITQNLYNGPTAREAAGAVDHAATVARRGGKY